MRFPRLLTRYRRWRKKCSPFTADHLEKPNLTIGRYTYGIPQIHRWSEKHRVEIGAFCSIAEEVHLLVDGNHRSDWISTYPFGHRLPGFRKNPGHPTGKGGICIGNDVWLGYGAVLLSGVRIGHGAIVAAGAVVTRDVAPYEIVGGNPARSLGFRFAPKQIAALLEIAWWEWPLEKIRQEIGLLESGRIEEFIAHHHQQRETTRKSLP